MQQGGSSGANLIGAGCTPFGKHVASSHQELAAGAVRAAVADAGLEDGGAIEQAWFGNCTLHRFGQPNVRGQTCLSPLQRERLLPARLPVINVENACATGSSALYGAIGSVSSGQADLVLALGVEKLFPETGAAVDLRLFEAGLDQLEPARWRSHYQATAARLGVTFAPDTDRSIAIDTYALQAIDHMRRFGITQRHLALAASQTHAYAARNPLAQYRFAPSVEQVLADRPVTHPFTRAMCAPVSDGAAAALVCSDGFLARCPPRVRARAIRIRACAAAGGKLRDVNEPSLARDAAHRAYRAAGLAPEDVSVAEVHDATSFSLIYQAEMMGFCEVGHGGALIESGATGPDGRIPLNTSGGLVGKGHPVGATGLGMICELMMQLREEAGARQVRGAQVALAENGGGIIGFDEAVCFVTLLDRAA